MDYLVIDYSPTPIRNPRDFNQKQLTSGAAAWECLAVSPAHALAGCCRCSNNPHTKLTMHLRWKVSGPVHCLGNGRLRRWRWRWSMTMLSVNRVGSGQSHWPDPASCRLSVLAFLSRVFKENQQKSKSTKSCIFCSGFFLTHKLWRSKHPVEHWAVSTVSFFQEESLAPTHAALQDQSPKLAQLTFDLCITIVRVHTKQTVMWSF